MAASSPPAPADRGRPPRSGKPVVTANKALLAPRAGGTYLSAVAAAQGVDLNFEAAVAGAIPIIRTLRESLVGEQITRVMGIVNGTTNYILSKMAEEGRADGDSAGRGRVTGPGRAPLDGRRRGLRRGGQGGDPGRAGIRLRGPRSPRCTARDLLGSALDRRRLRPPPWSMSVKLLAVAERVGGQEISVRVHPAMVPRSTPSRGQRRLQRRLRRAEASGALMLYGQGAGGLPTAGGARRPHRRRRHLLAGTTSPAPVREPARRRPRVRPGAAFYLTLDVFDRPGVLAAVAGLRGPPDLHPFDGAGGPGEARAGFVTHEANEADMAADHRGPRGARGRRGRVGGLLAPRDRPRAGSEPELVLARASSRSIAPTCQ